MTELKPCPFCGCEVEIRIGVYTAYYLAHPETDCMLCGFASYFTKDKNELINDWNRRVEE